MTCMSCLIKFTTFSGYNRRDNQIYQINYVSNSPNNTILSNRSNNLFYRNHLLNKKNESVCFVYPGSLTPIYNTSLDNVDYECSICLENGTNTVLKCGHIYHYKCMLEWVKVCITNKTDLTCPLCRGIECKKIKINENK